MRFFVSFSSFSQKDDWNCWQIWSAIVLLDLKFDHWSIIANFLWDHWTIANNQYGDHNCPTISIVFLNSPLLLLTLWHQSSPIHQQRNVSLHLSVSARWKMSSAYLHSRPGILRSRWSGKKIDCLFIIYIQIEIEVGFPKKWLNRKPIEIVHDCFEIATDSLD